MKVADAPSTFQPPVWVGAAGLAAIVLLAYSSSFRGVFVFDDLQSIVDNTSLRHWTTAWLPPGGGTTVSGRPLLNFSLALNYRWGGPNPLGFHVGNLLIHWAAALALWGVLRRTGATAGIALLATMIWAVHPLQTESVTYVVQRAESLMGLFYLLTLYGWIRGGRWRWLSVIACWLGMATKEVMVTAPVVVFLYDGLFLHRSWREAWRSNRGFYGALSAGWLLLAVLVAGTGGNRNGSIGFGIAIPWWKYTLTEFHVILRYLRLTVWPSPLVFYYNPEWARSAGDVLPGATAVAALAALTVAGFVRRKAWAFLGAWFFLILAPTSSIVPGATQTIAEHRMYLPLAAVVVGLAVLGSRWKFNPLWLTVPLLVVMTWERNQVYSSSLALWTDTVEKAPGNELALHNLGNALLAAGRPAEAIARYREALALRPDDAKAHHNLGYVLLQSGRAAEAVPEFAAALKVNPDLPEAQLNLGNAYLTMDQPTVALPHLVRALQLTPSDPKVHYNLALALYGVGRDEAGLAELREAVRLDAGYAPARSALARMSAP